MFKGFPAQVVLLKFFKFQASVEQAISVFVFVLQLTLLVLRGHSGCFLLIASN